MRKVLGVLIGLVGIVLLTTGSLALSHLVLMGIAACLVATACYAIARVPDERVDHGDRGGMDAKLVALGSQIGATLFMLPVFIGSVATQPPVQWNHPGVWLCVLALGLVCTAWAYILFLPPDCRYWPAHADGHLPDPAVWRTVGLSFPR